MSIISTILNLLALPFFYFSFKYCWSGNWKLACKGFVGLFIASFLWGMADVVHLSDEQVKQKAVKMLREDDARLISTHFRDEAERISDASAEIKQQQDKIREMVSELEKKTANVQGTESKKLLETKLQSLNAQISRLDASLNQLEQCAFEQVLLNFANELPGGPGVAADFQYQVNKELRIMQQVMQEVENMK